MKILLIQTGGSIDKDYPKTKLGFAFEITDSAALRVLEKINPSFEYEFLSLFKKDSLLITNEDRIELYQVCKNAMSDKIIITHGTDTMIETAEILSDIKNKVIIITGSFRPEQLKNSDADFIIGVATGALNILKEGVYVAMNGCVFKHNEVSRDDNGKFIKK